MQRDRPAASHGFSGNRSGRLTAYVKSDLYFAKHDSQQGNGDHGRRCEADKHTDHENDLFHCTTPSQVLFAHYILPVWRKFLKDHVTYQLLRPQHLVVGNFLAWATILPLQDGIDISIVAEGMEMWGASSMLYPTLNVSDMVLASGVVLVLGFLASLSPAWRASRYEPVEAITKV